MQLLVSAASAADATAALEGGADIVDAKDPAAGALGAVRPNVLREIHARVGGARLVTAALGDAADEVDEVDEVDVERAARAAATGGAGLVKIGFAHTASVERATTLTRAAVRGAVAAGAPPAGVVVVGYADAPAGSLALGRVIEVARASGARGVLVDTAHKDGPGLFALLPAAAVAAWVAEARGAGLLVALAGRLGAAELPAARAAGAHVVGVRGAACDGGRGGFVSADKVRALRAVCHGAAPARPTSAALPLHAPGAAQH